MGFIAIDGFADRYYLNNGVQFDSNNDGFGLYPQGMYLGSDSYFPNVSRQEGRYGDYCAMLSDSSMSVDNQLISFAVTGETLFSGGIAFNSADGNCQLLFGTDYNTGGSTRRYGPVVECDKNGEFLLKRSLVGSTTTEVVARSNKARITMWGWHYFTFQCRVEGLTTDWFKGWLDGELIFDVTGTKINNGGLIDYLDLPSGIDAIDDMWLRNDTNYITEPRVIPIFPEAAGTDSEGDPVGESPNYMCVDDFEQDFEGSYNLVDLGEKDSFQMTSLSDEVAAGTIHALVARFLVKGEPGNTDQLRPYVIVGSTKYNGSSYAVSNDYWRYVQHIWVENPDTSSPWIVSDIDNVQIGYEVV